LVEPEGFRYLVKEAWNREQLFKDGIIKFSIYSNSLEDGRFLDM
jgi:hypothetical protein